jgi:hypothetical protein
MGPEGHATPEKPSGALKNLGLYRKTATFCGFARHFQGAVLAFLQPLNRVHGHVFRGELAAAASYNELSQKSWVFSHDPSRLEADG